VDRCVLHALALFMMGARSQTDSMPAISPSLTDQSESSDKLLKCEVGLWFPRTCLVAPGMPLRIKKKTFVELTSGGACSATQVLSSESHETIRFEPIRAGADEGRPSAAPEKLLRAPLLGAYASS